MARSVTTVEVRKTYTRDRDVYLAYQIIRQRLADLLSIVAGSRSLVELREELVELREVPKPWEPFVIAP